MSGKLLSQTFGRVGEKHKSQPLGYVREFARQQVLQLMRVKITLDKSESGESTRILEGEPDYRSSIVRRLLLGLSYEDYYVYPWAKPWPKRVTPRHGHS